MNVHALPKTTEKSLKRLGRGHGSGRGKTSGRGTKGRALALIKRLPFLRGKGKNPTYNAEFIPVNVDKLSGLSPKTEVTVELLMKEKIVDKTALFRGVKILGNGDINVPLIVKLPVSKSAQQKIEQAKGSVVSE